MRYILKRSGVETRIFWDNWVNTCTIAADNLAPCDARSSVAMILIVQDKLVLVFHKEVFQLPAPPET